MKNKVLYLLFTVLCLTLCAIPFLGMFISPSNEAVGNEKLAPSPSLTQDDGSLNTNYIPEIGKYFDSHFALRPLIISLDAEIQSKIFGVSNIDSVTVGKDGWLFYSSTLDDYLGKNTMSEREIFCTVNNLELVSDYLEEQGVDFLFTVAPNKNSLYGDKMPYYLSVKESTENNLKSFTESIGDSFSYCDLLTPLSKSTHPLYLKEDSHWSNTGALVAYKEIIQSLSKTPVDFSDASPTPNKDFYGDLSNMLYPATAQGEYNTSYDFSQFFTYVTPTKSIEEPIIMTQSPTSSGRLYMYRDSFGNALLPFMASSFETAYFTKAFPINLALETQIYKSDTVVFEIAERNLELFSQSPPIIPAKAFELSNTYSELSGNWDIKAAVSTVNTQYVEISGSISSNVLETDSRFAILMEDSDTFFKAFTTTNSDTDFCFTAYIPKELAGKQINMKLAVINQNESYISGSINTEILEASFE